MSAGYNHTLTTTGSNSKHKIKGYSITRSIENEKQLSSVSSNTRNRGHKMKLVGGRLNKKKRRRQILTQHVAELWKSLPQDAGETRTLCALSTHGKEKSDKGR